MIVTFGNGKGGVGKSFAAANTVVELNDRGYRTAFIDGQKDSWPTAKRLSLFDRSIHTYPVSSIKELRVAIERARALDFHVVIDWAGELTHDVAELCSLTDLFLVPFTFGEQEFLQTANTITLIRAQQLLNGGKPDAYVFLNKTRKRDASVRKYRKLLGPLGLPIAESRLRTLDEYRDNRSVMRDPTLNSNNAATDIRALLDETVMPHFMDMVANG